MTEGDGENCQRMTEHLQSPQAPPVIPAGPSCHPRRLSPTFLIGDLVKEGIQCRSLPLLCNPVGQVSDASPDIFAVRRARNLSDYASLIRPTRCQRIGEHLQSLTLVPDLIGIQSRKGSRVFCLSLTLVARAQRRRPCVRVPNVSDYAALIRPTNFLWNGPGTKERPKTLDPRLQMSRMTEGERSRRSG